MCLFCFYQTFLLTRIQYDHSLAFPTHQPGIIHKSSRYCSGLACTRLSFALFSHYLTEKEMAAVQTDIMTIKEVSEYLKLAEKTALTDWRLRAKSLALRSVGAGVFAGLKSMHG